MTHPLALSSEANITYTYHNANRLTNVNGQPYTWDNNGNLLNDGAQTYGYDQANRLKHVVQGANTYTFGYNGVGDRLSQTVGITTTRYVLDPAAGLTQVLADGTNTYLYGNARLAQYQIAMQYFGADGLGSVRQLYDASGQVVAANRYDPYGNLMNQSGSATSVFGFTGEQQDATGLTYLRARYYSAAQGRFTTRDVWEGDPNAPMSYNAWNYTNGNPVNLTDPSGQDPWWCDNRSPESERQRCYADYANRTATSSGKTAYLTFDDGPDPVQRTTQIAVALSAQGAKATFFVTGTDPNAKEPRVLQECPSDKAPQSVSWDRVHVVSLIKGLGHAVGVHGWIHTNLWDRATTDPAKEVQQVVDALKSINVSPDPLLRAPGGQFPAGKIKGYENWYYYSWDIPHKMPLLDSYGTSAKTVIDNLDSELRAAGCPNNCPENPIILLHSINQGTADAVADTKAGLLARLRQYEYTRFLSLVPARPGDRPGSPIGKHAGN